MNTHTLRIIVIEDEPSIQGFLVQELNKFEQVEVIATAKQIDEAFHVIIEKQPDALFLDIKLIGGDAFQLIDRLIKANFNIPSIALCTGFPEYAVDALNDYHKYIIKYLTKPLEADWQERISNIVDEFWIAKKSLPSVLPYQNLTEATHNPFFVLSNGDYVRLYFEDILWLEVGGGGIVFVVTDTQDIKVETSLTAMQKKLDRYFYQISRSNIVNLNKIQSVNRSERQVMIHRQGKPKYLSVGDSYYGNLLKMLGIKQLHSGLL